MVAPPNTSRESKEIYKLMENAPEHREADNAEAKRSPSLFTKIVSGATLLWRDQ